MPATAATAPGKIILFGEHAVVYGRPAIAVPVSQVRARAIVMAEPLHAVGDVLIQAPDIRMEAHLDELHQDHPLARAIRLTAETLNVTRIPACTIRVSSTIPIAAGIGSGAAVSVALVRAFSSFLGRKLNDDQVSELAFEVDRLYHGTPSGIDNSVIAHGLPVFFVRNQPIQLLRLPVPFTIMIGDTGIQSPTAAAVEDVRRGWQARPLHYEQLFNEVEQVTEQARRWIETGEPWQLGELMDRNHLLLSQIGVSSPDLDRLVEVARRNGALGAKLSGGGRGGNMIALVEADDEERLKQALLHAGAAQVITTSVHASKRG